MCALAVVVIRAPELVELGEVHVGGHSARLVRLGRLTPPLAEEAAVARAGAGTLGLGVGGLQGGRGALAVGRCCSEVWRWCSCVWRRVEGCGGGVVVCGGVWRGVEVV